MPALSHEEAMAVLSQSMPAEGPQAANEKLTHQQAMQQLGRFDELASVFDTPPPEASPPVAPTLEVAPEGLSAGGQAVEVGKAFGQGVVRDAGEFFADVSDLATDMFYTKFGRTRKRAGFFDESSADKTREGLYQEYTDPLLKPGVDLDLPEHEMLQNLTRGARFAGGMVGPGKVASVAGDVALGGLGGFAGSALTDSDLGATVGGILGATRAHKGLAKTVAFPFTTMADTARWIFRTVGKDAEMVKPNDAKVRKLLNDVIDKYADSPSEVRKVLKADMSEGDFSTIGEMTGDKGIRTFEQGLSKQYPEAANTFKEAVDRFFDVKVDRARGTVSGSPSEFAGEVAQTVKQAELAIPRQQASTFRELESVFDTSTAQAGETAAKTLARSQQGHLLLKGSLQGRTDPTRTLTTPAEASEKVYEAAVRSKTVAKKHLDDTWDEIPDDVRIPTDPVKKAIKTRLINELRDSDYELLMKKHSTDIDDMLGTLKKPVDTPQELAHLRGLFRSFKEQAAGSTGVVPPYTVKGLDIIQDELKKSVLNVPQTSKAYEKAVNETFNYHDTYNAGALKQAYKQDDPFVFAEAITPTGAKGASATEEVKAIDDLGDIQESLDGYMRSKFEAASRDPRGGYIPDAADEFFSPDTSYGEYINRRPELKSELAGVTAREGIEKASRESLTDKKALLEEYKVERLAKAKAAKAAGVARAEKTAEGRKGRLLASSMGKIKAGADPVEHLQGVLRSPMRKSQINTLAKEAKRARGPSLSSLQATTMEAVIREIVKDSRVGGRGIKTASAKYTDTWKEVLEDSGALSETQVTALDKIVKTGEDMVRRSELKGSKFDYAHEPASKKFIIGYMAARGAQLLPKSTLKTTSEASGTASRKLLVEPNEKTIKVLGEIMANPDKYPEVMAKVGASKSPDETASVIIDYVRQFRTITKPGLLARPLLDEDEETK